MKTKIFLFSSLAIVAAIVAVVSCSKTADNAATGRGDLKSVAACSCSASATSDSTISGVISSNRTLSSTKTYYLSGLVFVTSGATLTIQAGTVIKGLAGSGVTGGTPGGGLIITRGCKINAQGTSTCPIVFTSSQTTPASGDWSGIILLGNAPTNNGTTTVIEGLGTYAPSGVDVAYGGSVAADNSGTLRFVRIEYAGYAFSANNEINGLTFGGVGSGTTIDYVEVYKANDDAFEWFGGTVNASHLLAVDALDDMFDTDNGYVGTISYALGMSDLSRADQSQSNGLESDNNSTGSTATPITHPTYNYLTIIGVTSQTDASITTGSPSGAGKYGRAAHLRRNAEFTIQNAIFMGFNYGISLDTQYGTTLAKFTAGTSTITNTYVQAFVTPLATESNGVAASQTGFTGTFTASVDTSFTESNPNTSIALAAPFTRTSSCAANFIPGATSLADIDAGAFPQGTDWTVVDGCCNWARY
jgi:hypothetical protein